jgi:minichromosome maintenance protein 10
VARPKRRGTAEGRPRRVFIRVSVVVVSSELINRSIATFRTSGLGDNTKKKPAYDPARQWGLKPEGSSSGSTYVFSGHVISGSAGDSRSMYIGETIGREAQARASRISAKDADRTLKALLEKDKEGTRALLKARQASGRGDANKGTDMTSSKRKSETLPEDSEEEEGSSQSQLPRKNAYSADVIRKLGFDPTSKAGKKNKHEVAELQKKVIGRSSSPRLPLIWCCGFVWCADRLFSIFIHSWTY